MINNITKDELEKRMKQDPNIQIVNVLEPAYYNLGFINGSKKIPVSQLDSRMNELNKTKEIIVYCAGQDCKASHEAAEKLFANGFQVLIYNGGLKEWKSAGLPMEPGLRAA